MMNYAQVYEVVHSIIADILSLEPDEIQAESRFFEDLNGESIDMLELTFRLEKHYKQKFSLQQMAAADLAVDETGRFTPEALDALRRECPYLNVAAIADDPRQSRISELITVDAITHTVLRQLSDEPAKAPEAAPTGRPVITS